jgi:hypothetical protein
MASGCRLQAAACSVESSDQFPEPRRMNRHFSLKSEDWSLQLHDADAEKIFAYSEEIEP